MSEVEAYRRRLDDDLRAMVDALRELAAGAHSGLTESIKWNAPSFALDGADRITLGLMPGGRGVRVVVHRGVAKSVDAGFRFDDHAGLARWPASDRGVMVFATLADIEARRAELSDFFTRWIAAAT